MASLLRTRLIEDLRIRNYASSTIDIYVRCVALFAKHFGRSPEELGAEEVREYQLHLREEKKASWNIFQPDGKRVAFSVRKDVEARLERGADPVPEAGETIAGCSELRGGLEAVFVCTDVDELHDIADDVWSRSEVDGSGKPEKERYRQ